MKYKIVTHYDSYVFERLVQELLDAGWQLQGGVSIAVNSSNTNEYFAQALVKTD